MRRYIPYGIVGISCWLMALGTVSCSSDEDFEPSRQDGAVKTQMAVSVPQGGRTGRMTSEKVQENANFRGLSDAWLVPLKKKTTTFELNGAPNFLGNIGTFDDATANVKIYKDVEVLGATEQMLFYGQATPTTNDPFDEGVLTSNLQKSTAALTDIRWNLEPCMGAQNAQKTAFEAHKTAICAGLKGILTAAEAWKASTNALQKSIFEKIAGMKAGAAPMIRLTLQEIYQVIGDSKAKLGAEVDAVLAAIASPTADGQVLFRVAPDRTLSWQDEELGKFPSQYRLPDGSVQLEYDQAKNEYQYSADSWIGEDGTQPGIPSNRINLKNICYPAALAYFVQSPLLVSEGGDLQTQDWAALWSGNTLPAAWKEGAVDNGTQAIALKEKVQYGTALLKTAFQCGASELGDRRTDYKISVGEGFPVTAILVGGQPSATGWDFLPLADAQMDRVIYDRKMLGSATPLKAVDGKLSAYNYTLVMPNAHASEKDVHIAVELKNTTTDNIYGADDGVIPPGGTFYLIGTLKLPANPGTHTAVFESDHYTTANITIKSLKNAYITIPDLRSVKLQVGMYVDIEWGRFEYGETDLGV